MICPRYCPLFPNSRPSLYQSREINLAQTVHQHNCFSLVLNFRKITMDIFTGYPLQCLSNWSLLLLTFHSPSFLLSIFCCHIALVTQWNSLGRYRIYCLYFSEFGRSFFLISGVQSSWNWFIHPPFDVS